MLCMMDDAQWLDRASAKAFAFPVRRFRTESVAAVFAAREPIEELGGLRELVVGGLLDRDARELLLRRPRSAGYIAGTSRIPGSRQRI